MTQFVSDDEWRDRAPPELIIPKEYRPPVRRDNDPAPRYFATLHAAWRHPAARNMPFDTPGRYHQVERDEPLANEFRAHFFEENGEVSMPPGQ